MSKGLTEVTAEPVSLCSHSSQVGLLVTQELESAIADCRAKVQQISKRCRASNTRFRDLEFDIEKDKYICLSGLFPEHEEVYDPADVLRVTQIFDKPKFFKEKGAESADVSQGKLGDCWFLSALATVSTFPGLIEKICVERDEAIGVYGFIFFKDNAWTSVIIDDLLYTSIPKYEELKREEKALYHFDKDFYNKNARKNGKVLYFARSGSSGETWVPLIEKAYAKIHGNFPCLSGGYEREGMEDLTGGVSIAFDTKDIWDVDRFWKEELSLANQDRLFGCWFGQLDASRNEEYGGVEVQGLFGGHAYSVLRAVECNGKRFIVCRNPWGRSEWTGRWSDGSKEWTHEWLVHLREIGHTFGDDGQFVMEYSDWLQTFSSIDRTIIFDSTWRMSSEYLFVPVAPAPSPWSYGDVSFTFVLSAPSRTIIALSELDHRYFNDLASKATWDFNFVLVKEGEKEPLAESTSSGFASRGVNIDIHLEAGNYYVYPRLDRQIEDIDEESPAEVIPTSSFRHLSRMLVQCAKSQSIASNFDFEKQKKHIPVSLRTLIENDLKPVEASNERVAKDSTDVAPAPVTSDVAPVTVKEIKGAEGIVKFPDDIEVKGVAANIVLKDAQTTHSAPNSDGAPKPDEAEKEVVKDVSDVVTGTPDVVKKDEFKIPRDDDNTVCLGLSVYTHKDVPVVVKGRLPVRDVKA